MQKRCEVWEQAYLSWRLKCVGEEFVLNLCLPMCGFFGNLTTRKCFACPFCVRSGDDIVLRYEIILESVHGLQVCNISCLISDASPPMGRVVYLWNAVGGLPQKLEVRLRYVRASLFW